MEEDQLTITMRLLAEGQQLLTDILSQLDKFSGTRTAKVQIVTEGGTGDITGAAAKVNSEVSSMNKSMQTMPPVAEQTSQKVSNSMGKSGMSGAFSNTRNNLNSLTGGMMGFLPIMAGFSLVSAASQFELMSKQVQAFAVASGTTAKVASDWVGVSGIYGLNANTLGLAIKGLQTKQVSLETTFNKTGSAVGGSTTALSRAIEKYGKGSAEVLMAENAIKIARDKVTTTNIAYQVSTERITTDQDKLTLAIEKYGKGSVNAQNAEQVLQTAQAHRITAQESVLKAQDAYAKAVGSTQSNLSTTQLAEQRLGVQLLDSKGKMIPATQILLEMADAYTKTGGSAQTVADITTILGGRAKAILPLFAEGSAGITQAIQQTQAAGGEMTAQQLKVGVAAGKTMADIKANIKNMFINLGSDLIPVFNFVDQHIKGIMQIAEAALTIFLTVKAIKFASGFISDVTKFVKGFTSLLGMGSQIGKEVAGLTSGSGGGGGSMGRIIGAQVTVAAFGGPAMEQLKLVGGLGGGGGVPNGLNTVEKDLSKGAGGTGLLGILGKIPGIGGLFGGAAAGTEAAGGMSIAGSAIGVGATAGIVALAVAPIVAMFANSQYTNSQHGDKAGATTGPTGGILSIPGLTSAISVGGGAFANFFDAVHKNTTTVTVMGRKITTVSDNMHDVQGKADMQGFFNDISKMKGFSGMTADQEQQLAAAVQNGTITSEPEMETWLANNHIITANSQTIKDNTQQVALSWNILKDGIHNTGPALASDTASLAQNIKASAGASNNIAQETSTIQWEFKNGFLKTPGDLAQIEQNWTDVSTATHGFKGATTFYTNLLNGGLITLQTPVDNIINYWKDMERNGLHADNASYKYWQLLQNAADQPAPPPIAGSDRSSFGTQSLPHGGAPPPPPPHKPTYHKNKNGHKTHYWAEGGLTNESIIGIGQSTGEEYHIGESGQEAILPMGKGRGGSGGHDGIALGHSSGGGGGGSTVVHVSFPNSLTFLNNATQIDELARAIETRLATVRLPHRGVRMSPH